MITLVFQSFDATTQHLTSTAEIVLGFDSPNVNYLPMCDFSRGCALQPREKKKKKLLLSFCDWFPVTVLTLHSHPRSHFLSAAEILFIF